MFSSCITLVLTAVQLGIAYRADVDELAKEFRQIESTHLPTMAESLWEVDRSALATQLTGMVQLRDMQYVALREGETLWAQAGARNSKNVIEREFPVVYRDRGTHRRLGTLTVVASLDGVYRRLVAQVVTILVSNALKTFLVALFMLALFHRVVLRHLASLEGYLSKAALSPSALRWHLQRKPSRAADAFDAVKAALDRMQESIEAAQAKLRASEARFRSLFEQAGDAALVTEPGSRRILDANSRAVALTGYSRDELLCMTADALGPDEARESDTRSLRDIRETGAVVFERTLVRSDGRRIDVEISACLIEIDGSEVVLGLARDLTERRKANEELKRFRAAMDVSGDAILLVDRTSMRYIDVNQTFCDLVGYTRQELLGKTPMDLFSADRETLERDYDVLIAGGGLSAEKVEGHYRHRNGSQIPIESQRRALRTGNGWIIVGSARDVTERKRSQDALAAQARQQAVVVEIGRLALTDTDRRSVFDEAVARIAQILDVEYVKVLECLPEGGALKFVAGFGWKEGLVGRAEVEAGRDSQAGFTLLSEDTVIVEDLRTETRFHGPRLLTDHGVVSGLSVIIGAMENAFGVLGAHSIRRRTFTPDEVHFVESIANVLAEVIRRDRARDTLRTTEGQYRTLVEQAAVGVSQVDADSGRFLKVNRRYTEIMGYTEQELLKLTFLEITHPDDRAANLEIMQQSGRGNVGSFNIEKRNIRKDGTPVWVHLAVSGPWKFGSSPAYFTAVIEDITQRKRAEDALRESSARLEAVTRQLIDAQESERRSIARELHDEVGSVLTAVKLNLLSLRRHLAGDAGHAALADGVALVDGAVRSVRLLALDLRPNVLDDLGLIPALRWYCEREAQRAGVEVELALDAIDLKSTPPLESACFRIVQASVTNALRHARARRIRVSLLRGEDSFLLEIADDGCGFDVPAVFAHKGPRQHLGLRGMQERAQLLGGTLTIESASGTGTCIRATFPRPDGGSA